MLEVRWRHAVPVLLAAIAAAGAAGLAAAGQDHADAGAGGRPRLRPAAATEVTRNARRPDPGRKTSSVPANVTVRRPGAARCDDAAAWTSAAGGGGAGAWSQMAGILDEEGRLTGYTLEAGVAGELPAFAVSLPAESFHTDPFGSVVVYGSDDGRRSHVRLLDVATGCEHTLVQAPDVIRRATLHVASRTVYYSMVERRTRQDLGVWRLAAGPAASPEQVMPPIDGDAPDARFGRTFSTALHWSVDARRLAVQSCGGHGCRTRILDLDDGTLTRIAGAPHGTVVALTPAAIVTFDGCAGYPCPLVATRLDTGERSVVAEDVLAARLVGAGDRAAIAVDVLTREGGRRRTSIGLDRVAVARDPAPAGVRP